MKRDIAMKWARDLENPRRKQAKGKLKKGDAYCCLGRLCIVVGREFDKRSRCDGARKELPGSVMQLAGMRTTFGALKNFDSIEIGGKTYGCLANANDEGRTFPEIAKAIRKNWRRL